MLQHISESVHFKFTAKLTRVHWPRSNIVDRDPLCRQLLGYTASEVLNGSLAACIRSVEAGKRSQQGSGEGDNLSALLDMFRTLFQQEECGFGIDTVRASC